MKNNLQYCTFWL